MLAIGLLPLLLASYVTSSTTQAVTRPIWQIASSNQAGAQFALAPNGYAKYTNDGLFIVDSSKPSEWPYVLPGPADSWAGSKPHDAEIVFGLKPADYNQPATLDIQFADSQSSIPPKISVYVNQQFVGDFQSPKGGGDGSISGDMSHAVPSLAKFSIPASDIRAGNNVIEIKNGEGSWILFKSISLSAPSTWSLAKVTPQISLKTLPQAQIVYRTSSGPKQPVDWEITNIGPKQNGTYSLSERGSEIIKGELSLEPGRQVLSTEIPQVSNRTFVTLNLKLANVTMTSSQSIEPVRHWIIDLMPHAHLDVGYTNTQAQVSQIQRGNLLNALEVRKESDSNPADSQYHYSFEGNWILSQALHLDSPTEIQKIKQGLDDGVLYCSAAYANELTGIMRDEEMMQSYRFGQIYGSKLGTKFTVASQTDVPGVTWGDTVALHDAGIKALLLMPNPADRLGDVIRDWQDKPFWWELPDGKNKILLWETVSYGMAHGIRHWNGDHFHIFRTKDPDKNFIESYIFPRLATLAGENYPYRLIAIPWSDTDNSPVDGDVPKAAKDWNKKYVIPEVRLRTFQSACDDMIQMYGSKLPTYTGDLSPYWEDGAGSSAAETSMNRWSADRLSQAEALSALINPASYSSSAFMQAWSNVVLFSEHTWGSYDSISQPNDPFTKAVWNRKKQYAEDAHKESLDLLKNALKATRSSKNKKLRTKAGEYLVWNTESWNRDGVVTLTASECKPDDRVESWPARKPILSQKLANGETEVLVSNIPAYGSAEIRVVKGRKDVNGSVRASGEVLENQFVRIHINPKTGAIDHYIVLKTGHDFSKPNSVGLNRYQYLIGGDLKDVQFSGQPKMRIIDNGPLKATIELKSSAPGTSGYTVDYTLYENDPTLHIIDTLEKLPVLKKESVHIAFPFAVQEGIIRDDLPWSVIQPEKDQLPGANRNWLTTNRYVDVSNSTEGIALTSKDAPLIEIGGITANIMGGGYQSSDWIKHLPPTQTVESWALNNVWYTNYLAEQSGKLIFRYDLYPHGEYNEAVIREHGTDCTEPLLIGPAFSAPSNTLCRVIGKGVMATCLKPSDDGHGYIIRLWGASSKDQIIAIKWRNNAKIQVWKSNLAEEKLHKLNPNQVNVPHHGEVTLKIELK